MPEDIYRRVLRIKMWEIGHDFEKIDNYTLQDMGDILAYWHEKERINKKRKPKKRGA